MLFNFKRTNCNGLNKSSFISIHLHIQICSAFPNGWDYIPRGSRHFSINRPSFALISLMPGTTCSRGLRTSLVLLALPPYPHISCSIPPYICTFLTHTFATSQTKYSNDSNTDTAWHCQAGWVSDTPPLPFWTYHRSWTHSIIRPCTCVNDTSCNQLKVVPEPEMPVPRDKEGQCGVGDTRATSFTS